RYAESPGSQLHLQPSAKRSLRRSLSWGRRDSGNVQLLPHAHVLRFRFARPNCARQQNSTSAADQVFGLGSGEFFGPKEHPVSSTLIENRRKLILAGADKLSLRGCS